MVLVTVTEGVLEGEIINNEYGGTFYSFKGIPYAEPPVGHLRFKAPLPPKSWEGVRSANKFGSKCCQIDVIRKTGKDGSEDSLYLNVYTPNVKPDKPLPVMFWIHGGGFLFGCGDDFSYGPEFLIKQEVVIVTINYRVGVHGFLCLHTEDVPGNAGMKDQVEALRWVNKNISNFGGDPKNITIFGESAGGASVSYHLISPMTKGLFKRAIVQSGTALCNWARAYEPRERALALARQLGCYSETDKDLYEFFINQPAEALVGVPVPMYLSEKFDNALNIYFSIVAERQFGDNERFFAGDFNSVHEDVEIMIGYNTDEGLVRLGSSEVLKRNMELVRDFPEYFVTKPLALNLTTKQQLELGKKIRNYYFKNPNDLSDWESFVNFHSMDMFKFATLLFTKICAKKNKVFMYRFGCSTERNIVKRKQFGIDKIVGNKQACCHGDDLLYIFNNKIESVDMKSDIFKLIERVTRLWSNFAYYGNPTPDGSDVKWPQYSLDKQDYLEISNEFVAGTAPDAEELLFWEDFIKEYGKSYF